MRMRGWQAALLASAALLVAGNAFAAVDVRVRLERRSISVGESVALEVLVSGAMGGVSEPDLGLPGGVEVLASSRGQSFSWVNGSSTSSVSFRYELAAAAAGHYKIGPVRVKVGSASYLGASADLDVVAAPRQVAGTGGGGPASLVAEVSPSRPYVGQLAVLRVRLIQRAAMVEDPQYAPPATTGFWSERTSDPESYYAQQGGGRVLVTETRTRLYPLAPGKATISEANATLVMAQGDPTLPFFGGSRRVVTLQSVPLAVDVRPLPGGAPAGFGGAVGTLSVRWRADRASTARDVPLIARLEVRGVGNLPLLRTPPLVTEDFEIFGTTLEDSLAAPGSAGSGRRTFQWTLLPKRLGRLTLEGPAFTWFDPEAGQYVRASLPALVISVGPATGGPGSGEEAFPAVFGRHPADPGARPGEPWALALAGALLGCGVALWRRARPDRAETAAAAQQREWLRAVGLARGPEFWNAADRASAWLVEQGRPVGSVPREISAARYGGQAADEDRIRRRLVELLSANLAGGPARAGLRLVAVGLAAASVALAIGFGPQAGGDTERLRARRADERARRGELEAARVEWLTLWRNAHAPSLAARLAWFEVRRGRVGEAAAWVVRGDAGDPRDPALGELAERVGEAGGLSGERRRPIPLKRWEWGALAALAAIGAGWLWPRRAAAVTLLAMAALLGGAPAVERAIDGGVERGALLRTATLEGGDVELEAGQVVRILGRVGDRLRVRVGKLEGTLPAIVVAGTGAPR